MFATCYLGLEVGCKILAALLRQALGVGTMLFFLSVVAGVSFVGMLFVYPLKENDKITQKTLSYYKVREGVQLLTKDPKMLLMLPTQMAFGFMAAFLNTYVAGAVKDKYDSGVVLYMSALIAGTATVFSSGSTFFQTHTGLKWPMMLLGATCFALEALAFLLVDNTDIVGALWSVALVYIAHGIGRGAFESTNKGVIAEFFPE